MLEMSVPGFSTTAEEPEETIARMARMCDLLMMENVMAKGTIIRQKEELDTARDEAYRLGCTKYARDVDIWEARACEIYALIQLLRGASEVSEEDFAATIERVRPDDENTTKFMEVFLETLDEMLIRTPEEAVDNEYFDGVITYKLNPRLCKVKAESGESDG